MPSVALREGGQLASNGNKTLKGYNNNTLPVVAFLLAKTSGVQRSGRRMPSKALATEGCAAANCDNHSIGGNDDVLHLYPSLKLRMAGRKECHA